MEQRYVPLLDWALDNRGKVIGAALVLFLLTLALVPQLGTELIPQLSQGEFNVDLRLPPGTPLITDRSPWCERAQRASLDLGGIALSYSVSGTRQPPRREPGRCGREHRQAEHHARRRCWAAPRKRRP